MRQQGDRTDAGLLNRRQLSPAKISAALCRYIDIGILAENTRGSAVLIKHDTASTSFIGNGAASSKGLVLT
jgi:hypothetical protein